MNSRFAQTIYLLLNCYLNYPFHQSVSFCLTLTHQYTYAPAHTRVANENGYTHKSAETKSSELILDTATVHATTHSPAQFQISPLKSLRAVSMRAVSVHRYVSLWRRIRINTQVSNNNKTILNKQASN